MHAIDIFKVELLKKLAKAKDQEEFVSRWNALRQKCSENESKFPKRKENKREKNTAEILFSWYLTYLHPVTSGKSMEERLADQFERLNKTPLEYLKSIEDFYNAYCEVLEMQDRHAHLLSYLASDFWRIILCTSILHNYSQSEIETLKELLVKFYYQNWVAEQKEPKKQTNCNIIKALKEKKNIDDIISIVKQYLDENKITQNFREKLKDDHLYEKHKKSSKNSWLRPILILVEYFMSDDPKPKRIQTNDFHVEHILPQKPTLSSQWAKDFSEEERERYTHSLANLTLLGVTSNTWGAGCAYVEETITALNNSLAHFGTQAEQIKQSELLARTILDFRGSLSNLNNTYNSITTTASNTPNSPFLKNLISQSTNPNNPEGLKTVYQLNQSAYSQLLSATQELGHNPFRRIGLISSQTNNGTMNGIGVQIGYKQFFGEKKRWGARYYGFFDYNHAYIKSSFFNSASDVFTYGVGTDVLYNFINDKATKNNKISFGVFGGIALAGTSWLNSQYVNLATFNNFYSAKMNVANFQFLFNLGLRMNLAKNKKKASDHAAQHGVELGVKIPTINTNYYSLLGTQLQYRRLYSVYLNYVFAY
ncbi:hypothetical protein HpBhutan61_04620 [Helicobacter pylori]